MRQQPTCQQAESVQPLIRWVDRWTRLALSLLVVSAIWLVGLPWLGRFSVVAEHIENQERQGIDPSAMFYTDLENLPSVVHRIERLQQSNREDFWSW